MFTHTIYRCSNKCNDKNCAKIASESSDNMSKQSQRRHDKFILDREESRRLLVRVAKTTEGRIKHMMKNVGLDDDSERKGVIILRNNPNEECLSSLSDGNCNFKDEMKSVKCSYDKKLKTRDLKENSLKEELKKEHLLNIANSEHVSKLEKRIKEKDQLMQISWEAKDKVSNIFQKEQSLNFREMKKFGVKNVSRLEKEVLVKSQECDDVVGREKSLQLELKKEKKKVGSLQSDLESSMIVQETSRKRNLATTKRLSNDKKKIVKEMKKDSKENKRVAKQTKSENKDIKELCEKVKATRKNAKEKIKFS